MTQPTCSVSTICHSSLFSFFFFFYIFLIFPSSFPGVKSALSPARRLRWEVLRRGAARHAERRQGGPLRAGQAATAAGGVPGSPALLPQLPAGTDTRAELQLAAQLPAPGEKPDPAPAICKHKCKMPEPIGVSTPACVLCAQDEVKIHSTMGQGQNILICVPQHLYLNANRCNACCTLLAVTESTQGL